MKIHPTQGRCLYCQQAPYERIAALCANEQQSSRAQSFNRQQVGLAEWEMRACPNCGHVIEFRKDLAKQ